LAKGYAGCCNEKKSRRRGERKDLAPETVQRNSLESLPIEGQKVYGRGEEFWTEKEQAPPAAD